MARKQCPGCGYVTAASAKTCKRCGQELAAPSAPPADRRARRCAMCGIVNAASVARCQCGFELDMPPEEARPFYLARRANAKFLLVGTILLGVFGTAAILAIVLTSPVIPIRGLAVGIGALVAAVGAGWRKAARILSATAINLAELDGKTEALPAARVVSRAKPEP